MKEIKLFLIWLMKKRLNKSKIRITIRRKMKYSIRHMRRLTRHLRTLEQQLKKPQKTILPKKNQRMDLLKVKSNLKVIQPPIVIPLRMQTVLKRQMPETVPRMVIRRIQLGTLQAPKRRNVKEEEKWTTELMELLDLIRGSIGDTVVMIITHGIGGTIIEHP
jgi:hypothetical protein